MSQLSLFLYLYLAGIWIILISIFAISHFKKKRQVINPDTAGWKKKISEILHDFARIALASLILLLILRSAQYIYFGKIHPLPEGSLVLELKGFFNDLLIFQFVSWIFFIPFLVLSLWKRWAGYLLSFLCLVVFCTIEWALFRYFVVTLTPLDEVVFSYSSREMILIAQHSIRISVYTFLPFVLLIAATAGLVFFSSRIRISRFVCALVLILSTCSVFFSEPIRPKEQNFRNSFEYYLTVNKSSYLGKRFFDHFHEINKSSTTEQILAATKLYQSLHPEFDFTGLQYPYLHYDNTPDVLSSFFNLKEERPNLVILICESLSACFSGNNNIFGSYTPFLDSLAGRSLYWPNFLSTADRTFHVLQAITASLPPGDPTFVNCNRDARYPYHLSLIRYLVENGYYTSFFYGGNPGFNNMEDFLKRQTIDFVLKDFGPDYLRIRQNEGYGWGYPDGDVFNRSFEVIDSLKKPTRLDLYLTLSTHPPFSIPDQEKYFTMTEKRMKSNSGNLRAGQDVLKYKEIFASVMYMDASIRDFFEKYSKRPEFQNTIFLITGDHAMSELNLPRFSMIERFHVPLIIYSPMLKKSEVFQSVSSHLDITPTLLAMLKNNFGIQTSNVASWMGRGIDTAKEPRNLHILPFILNSKQIPEYVNGSYYLSPFGVSRLENGLVTKDLNDPALEKKLKGELESYKILNIHVARENRMIPPEIYFGKALITDSLVLSDMKSFPADSVWEYHSFCKRNNLDPRYKLLKFEISVDFLNPGNIEKPPRLIFDFSGTNNKLLLWSAFDIFGEKMKTAPPGKWSTATISEYIDLNYLKDKENRSMLIYLWNNEKIPFRVANPKVRITAFY